MASESEEEEPVEASVPRFTRIHEKMFAGVTAEAWCPKMDLVALATTISGTTVVHVIRSISWEKLHSITPSVQCRATALVWSPDGRNISVGFENGHFLLFDVESGLPWPSCRSLTPLESGISCLRWCKQIKTSAISTKQGAGQQNSFASTLGSAVVAGDFPHTFCAPSSGGSLFSMFRDRAHRLVPRVGNLPVKKKFSGFAEDGVAIVSQFSGSRSRSDRILGGEANPDEFNVLAVGCTNGKIALYAYGDLLCAALEAVPPEKAFLNIGVSDLCVSADFSTFTTLLATNKGVKTPLPIVQLLVFDTTILHRFRRPLACASDHLREIWKLFDHMKQSTVGATKAWADATTPIKNILSKIAEAIAETSPKSNSAKVTNDREDSACNAKDINSPSPKQSTTGAIQDAATVSGTSKTNTSLSQGIFSKTPLHELLTACSDGPTHAISQFFSADHYKSFASPSALKRLLQTVRQALDQCQNIMRSHIAKPCETAIFRLAELKGLSYAAEAFSTLGYEQDSLTKTVKAFELFALEARGLLRCVVRVTSQLCSLAALLGRLCHDIETNGKESEDDGDNAAEQKSDTDAGPFCNEEVVATFLQEAIANPRVVDYFVQTLKSTHQNPIDENEDPLLGSSSSSLFCGNSAADNAPALPTTIQKAANNVKNYSSHANDEFGSGFANNANYSDLHCLLIAFSEGLY